MQEGWYCRNQQTSQAEDDSDESDQEETQGHQNTDYKEQYRYLNKKLKFLIYENEAFQDSLRSSQRRLLKVTRDRSFLLDRLLQYEKPSSSETDESSGDERKNDLKKQKVSGSTGSTRGRKRKNFNNIPQQQQQQQQKILKPQQICGPIDGHNNDMSAEELAAINKHLQSRQNFTELVPERAAATVPNELFSNEPSLDSESNDQIVSPNSEEYIG